MKVSGSSYEVVENDILKCHCKMSLIAPPNLLLVCSAGCLLQCLKKGIWSGCLRLDTQRPPYSCLMRYVMSEIFSIFLLALMQGICLLDYPSPRRRVPTQAHLCLNRLRKRDRLFGHLPGQGPPMEMNFSSHDRRLLTTLTLATVAKGCLRKCTPSSLVYTSKHPACPMHTVLDHHHCAA